MSSEPFRFQYRHHNNKKNYELVVEILKRYIEDGKLGIEVTEVDYHELDELRKDRERLEWLANKEYTVLKHGNVFMVSNFNGDLIGDTYLAFREAIDAAMKEEKK